MSSLPSHKKLSTGRFSILSVEKEEESGVGVASKPVSVSKQQQTKKIFGSDLLKGNNNAKGSSSSSSSSSSSDPLVVALECQSPGILSSSAKDNSNTVVAVDATSVPVHGSAKASASVRGVTILQHPDDPTVLSSAPPTASQKTKSTTSSSSLGNNPLHLSDPPQQLMNAEQTGIVGMVAHVQQQQDGGGSAPPNPKQKQKQQQKKQKQKKQPPKQQTQKKNNPKQTNAPATAYGSTHAVATGRFALLCDPSEPVVPVSTESKTTPTTTNKAQPLGIDPISSAAPANHGGELESGVAGFGVWAVKHQVWEQSVQDEKGATTQTRTQTNTEPKPQKQQKKQPTQQNQQKQEKKQQKKAPPPSLKSPPTPPPPLDFKSMTTLVAKPTTNISTTGRFATLQDPAVSTAAVSATVPTQSTCTNAAQPLGVADPRNVSKETAQQMMESLEESGATRFHLWAERHQIGDSTKSKTETATPKPQKAHKQKAQQPKKEKQPQPQPPKKEKQQEPQQQSKEAAEAPNEVKKVVASTEAEKTNDSKNVSAAATTPPPPEKEPASVKANGEPPKKNKKPEKAAAPVKEAKKKEKTNGTAKPAIKEVPVVTPVALPPPKKSYASAAKTAPPETKKPVAVAPIAATAAAVVTATPVPVVAKASEAEDTKPLTPSSSEAKKLLVLVSLQSFEREVVANQDKAATVLKANGVKYDTLDGADLTNKARRNELFGISGKRAKYPQFFLVQGSQTTFWGDFETFQTVNDQGRIAAEFGGTPLATAPSTPPRAKVTRKLPEAHPSPELEKKFPQFFKLQEGKKGWGHQSQVPAEPGINSIAQQEQPSDPRFLVLVSNQSLNREAVANQQKATTILNNNAIPHELLDGADPANRDRRNELFAMSGLRGHYPQFFLVQNGKTSFWGGWERFEEQNDEDGLKSVLASVVSTKESAAAGDDEIEIIFTTEESPDNDAPAPAEQKNDKDNAGPDLKPEVAVASEPAPTPPPEKKKETKKEPVVNEKPKQANKPATASTPDKTKSQAGKSRALTPKQKAPKTIESDITVYGATGFSAKHVLAYILQSGAHLPKTTLKVTLAGRNKSKLEPMAREFSKRAKNQSIVHNRKGKDKEKKLKFDHFVAESTQMDRLRQMASRTKVVINCAGPYSRYGAGVVAACAEVGTDYVDITGEVQWASRMRDEYGRLSQESGARIISFCGFDSIPSDLAVFAAVDALRKEVGKKTEVEKACTYHVCTLKGNSGTLHTILDIPLNLLQLPYLMTDPLALAHEKVRTDPAMAKAKRRLYCTEWFNQLLFPHLFLNGGFTAPFAMSVVNAKVVHESSLAHKYGPNFVYFERHVPLGFRWTQRLSIISIIAAIAVEASVIFCLLILKLPLFGGMILRSFFPLGSGMTDEECQEGSAEVYADVMTAPNPTTGKVSRASCHLKFTGDIANWVTAQCVCESAFCLLLDKDKLPHRSVDGFGSPAELLGGALLKRLRLSKVRPVECTTNARKVADRWETKIYNS